MSDFGTKNFDVAPRLFLNFCAFLSEDTPQNPQFVCLPYSQEVKFHTHTEEVEIIALLCYVLRTSRFFKRIYKIGKNDY